jgi:hypothetical protein
MDVQFLLNDEGDFDLNEINQLVPLVDSPPWPPPNLSAIDLRLALLHANIKHSATIPGGQHSA